MSQFTDELVVEPVDEIHWKLLRSFEYHVGSYPSKTVIKIPEGFITDFASVPRLFWNIFPPYGRYGKAAVVHDYCYSTSCYKRKICDQIFLEGMTVLNVKRWKRTILYYSVRLFGWKSWKKHRREN